MHHRNVDETVHCLEGTFSFTVDGKLHEPCFTPALIGPAYFREIGDIVNGGGPPDLAKMRAVMERYGLVLAA